jgi:acetyltransferase-like isoleucine patch superfamily enzyme
VTIDGFGKRGVAVGSNVTIGPGADIRASGVIAEPGEGVRIGDRTAIGARNVIWGQGGITIGDNCLLGPNVTVLSENHVANSATELVRDQGAVRAPVVIEDDCWIGAGATVLLGVRIGRGAVVGAGAVVTKDVESLAIVVGVPAKQIGQRGLPSEEAAPSAS